MAVPEAGMRYEGVSWRLDLPPPSLPGAHQIANAGIALACLEQLHGFSLPADAIAAGLRRIDWPARLQRLSRGPLAETLPPRWDLWLDGGHNPGAGQVLAEMAAQWRDRPLYLVVGMLNTKDAGGFLAPLASHAQAAVRADDPRRGERLASPPHRRNRARSSGFQPRKPNRSRPRCALLSAGTSAIGGSGPARVLICGSLHLAGIVLAENG